MHTVNKASTGYLCRCGDESIFPSRNENPNQIRDTYSNFTCVKRPCVATAKGIMIMRLRNLGKLPCLRPFVNVVYVSTHFGYIRLILQFFFHFQVFSFKCMYDGNASVK